MNNQRFVKRLSEGCWTCTLYYNEMNGSADIHVQGYFVRKPNQYYIMTYQVWREGGPVWTGMPDTIPQYAKEMVTKLQDYFSNW